MSEAELFELYQLGLDSALRLIQWWLSATVGLLGIAHFATKRLNLWFVSTLLLLYVFYTIWTINAFVSSADIGVGLLDSLRSLRDSGVALTPASEKLLEGTSQWSAFRSVVVGFVTVVCPLGAFVATIIYVLRSYRWAQRSQ